MVKDYRPERMSTVKPSDKLRDKQRFSCPEMNVDTERLDKRRDKIKMSSSYVAKEYSGVEYNYDEEKSNLPRWVLYPAVLGVSAIAGALCTNFMPESEDLVSSVLEKTVIGATILVSGGMIYQDENSKIGLPWSLVAGAGAAFASAMAYTIGSYFMS